MLLEPGMGWTRKVVVEVFVTKMVLKGPFGFSRGQATDSSSEPIWWHVGNLCGLPESLEGLAE